MRYALVTTAGWLLLVDMQTRQVQPIESNRPEYYGVSWFAEDDHLVLSHSGTNNEELVDVTTYAQSERGWLSFGHSSSCTFLSQPHQIICAPDGRVICTNTGRNVVSVFDFKKPNQFQEAGISDARWDRLALDQVTGDHLNSVYLQGEVLYVIAHAHSKGSKLAKFSYPDLGLISVEPLGFLTGLHNIWITPEGQKISCFSGNGSLIDLDDKKTLWESGAGTFTRGLAACHDFVLVGESQQSARDLRRYSMSGLWVIDRQTWRAIDYLCLGPYGAVNEVRLLDTPDLAHHGQVFSGLKNLLNAACFETISSERLETANLAKEHRHVWSNFRLIFGVPVIKHNAGKYAKIGDLSLYIQNHNTQLAFSYELEEETGAQVSAVLGYEGSGADCNMSAILLQPFKNTAQTSLWRHDGKAWICLTTEGDAIEVPLSGSVTLETQAKTARLLINNKEIMTLQAETIGLDRCDQGLGIRWMGATVSLPVDAP